MKKYLSLLLALCLTLSLTACGSKTDTSADAADGSQTQDSAPAEAPTGDPVELIVFAAASMTETMNQLKEMYEQNNPNVTVGQRLLLILQLALLAADQQGLIFAGKAVL